jgi:hypothetical protein
VEVEVDVNEDEEDEEEEEEEVNVIWVQWAPPVSLPSHNADLPPMTTHVVTWRTQRQPST